jgi:hypothetical protein
MWEYWRKDIRFKSNAELNEELNKVGAEGWEIIYFLEIKSERFRTADVLLKRLKKVDNEHNKG